MSGAPVRRAHLISPFGTGSLLVAPDGTSLLAAGVDYWFTREGSDDEPVDQAEFTIDEWRLERFLGIGGFRLPPDHRRRSAGGDTPNTGLRVPFLRFPQWHFCPRCKRLTHLPLTVMGRQPCAFCQQEGKRPILAQVPFVSMCDGGHLLDFPWREWVHQAHSPVCTAPMKLVSTGGATLANQLVKCECGARRSLSQVVEAAPDGSTTFLSEQLAPGAASPYLCKGSSPQHGRTMEGSCGRPIRGSLRSASNLYFAQVTSAIYLPRSRAQLPAELLEILRHPRIIAFLTIMKDSGEPAQPGDVRDMRPAVSAYPDHEIAAAVEVVLEEALTTISSHRTGTEEGEASFRLQEAEILREAISTPELVIRSGDPGDYAGAASKTLGRIQLVDRLRETRVLTGFNRVFPDQEMDAAERLGQLWAHPPARGAAWLPAYCVFGEGIYLELRDDLVSDWEVRPSVVRRASRLQVLYDSLRSQRVLRERLLTPRFLLVHTLAHVLMNQLTFECGYSSAALRERIYVSGEPERPIAALLIYTAAGDAEGTMGGLVRMGMPGHLEIVLERALEGARWCGADPVCMEIGTHSGQGPDSCNLAACHSCALVPETACEEFNRFLDRGLLIGSLEEPELAFFTARG